MKNKTTYIVLLTILLCIQSCSSSLDDEEGYVDDILSNTTWVQSYVEPMGSTTTDTFSLPTEITSRLDSALLSSNIITDTVRNGTSSGEYILSFGKSKCKLENVITTKGSYYLHTFKRETSHYPNQIHSWEYEDSEPKYEIEVKSDTLFFRTIYAGYGTTEQKQYIGQFYDDSTISHSEPVPYLKETKTTNNMNYLRKNREISFYGDKNMRGIINETYNKMEIYSIGTMYKN